MRRCSIDGCEAVHQAKGYCRTHYQRWKATGQFEPLRDLERSPAAVLRRVGITHRQLDSWIREGYVVLSTEPAGPGDWRVISETEEAGLLAVANLRRQVEDVMGRIRSGEAFRAGCALSCPAPSDGES